MKLKYKSDRSLESMKIFPYIAWGVTLAFAVFVFDIAMRLHETADQLAVNAAYQESYLTPVKSSAEQPN